MTLATTIQDRTNDGTSIVDFLFAVMRSELDGFKPCHRLDAAKLLAKYACTCLNPSVEGKSAVAEQDEARNFITDYTPDPPRPRLDTGSPGDNYFDDKLAELIRESTDDGRKVCRFLINVMDGALSAFKPYHRIQAARELLSRGFDPRRSGGEPAPDLIRGRNPEEVGPGGHGYSLMQRPPLPQGEGWDESLPRTRSGGENQEHQPTTSHSSLLSTHSSESEDSEDEDAIPYDEINPIIDNAIEESNRILKEQGIDPDNPPHRPDYSAFDLAADNSHRWFHEWKNSIDPEEYQAIVKEKAAAFRARIDLRIERRKQIRAARELREKEESERQAEQAKTRAKAKAEEEAAAADPSAVAEDLGPPPSREDHERWSPTPSIPTSFRLVNCGHPKCKLHDGPIYYPEDDKSSPYYWDGGPPITSRIFNPRF